jgi:hypothetical protein
LKEREMNDEELEPRREVFEVCGCLPEERSRASRNVWRRVKSDKRYAAVIRMSNFVGAGMVVYGLLDCVDDEVKPVSFEPIRGRNEKYVLRR